jgi:hypothetical protein
MNTLHIVITKPLEEGHCEFHGRPGEIVRVRFDADKPELVVSVESLIPKVRFAAARQRKSQSA